MSNEKENLLEQANESLLDSSSSVEEVADKTVRNKESVTRVTTIAEEEEKSGEKINVASAEELVAKANLSYITSLTRLEQKFARLSSKAKTRALISILSLPMGELPVKLKSQEEIDCFGLGQRIQADRFIILQHSINEQMKRLREAEENRKKALDAANNSSDNEEKGAENE